MPAPDVILPALWRASWQSSILCLLVLALRWTLRDRLPAAWRCRLWGLVFLRLLLPAVPASPVSLFNVVPADPSPSQWPVVTVVLRATAQPAAPVADVPPVVVPWQLPQMVVTLWLAGAVLFLALAVIAHVRFARRVRRLARPAPAGLADQWMGRQPLVVTDAVTSPALFGVVRGSLLLPPDLAGRLSPAELAMVFRHERAHVRRQDLAVGWAVLLVRCVYWFHPLVWLAERLRRADAESACDDAALAGARPDDRFAYGRALLAVAGGGRRVPAIGMADARTDLRRRLDRVAGGRPVGRWSLVAAAGLTAAVGCATLTGSNRPANVTRTYSNFWPVDYAPTPHTEVHGNISTTATPAPPVWDLSRIIRRDVTPAAWGHDGVDVHVEGTRAVVTAPAETQAQIERMIGEKLVQVSIETRVLMLRPSRVRAAGLALPVRDTVAPLASADVIRLFQVREADPTASILAAPRLTLFNGQKSQLVIETQQAYVSGATPVVRPGEVRFDPATDTVPSTGMVMSVVPSVSADHRSVTLTAEVQTAHLLSMDPVELTATLHGATTRASYQVPHSRVVKANLDHVTVASGASAWVRSRAVDLYGAGYAKVGPGLSGTLTPTGGLVVPEAAESDAPEPFVVWSATVLVPTKDASQYVAIKAVPATSQP